MAQPTPEVVQLVRAAIGRDGQEARFVLGSMGQSEWTGGSRFFDNDTVLAVTDSAFVFFSVQRKGFGGRRTEVVHDASFDFEHMSDLRAAGDEDGAPKMLKFVWQDATENAFIDIWADPQWDDMVSFWARQCAGDDSGHSAPSNQGSEAWRRIEDHIRTSYRADVQDGMIRLVFDLGDDRSQALLLQRAKLEDDDDEWVTVSSAVGRVSDMTLSALAQAIDGKLVGGIACAGDLVLFRDTLRVAGLDLALLDRVIVLVCVTADRLEQKLVGGDTY